MVDISDIDVNKAISTKNNAITINIESNRYIELIYLKQGKAKRTYVYGLEYFITDPKKLVAYTKKLQTELATGLVDDKDDTGRKRFGFNGKHGQTIKEKLINDLKISSDKIECKQIS